MHRSRHRSPILTFPFRTWQFTFPAAGSVSYCWLTAESSPGTALSTELLLVAASIHWLIIGRYKVLPSLASIRSTLKGLPSSKAPIRPPEASVATTSQFISSFAQSYFLHSPCAHKSHSLRIFPGKPTYNRTSMKYSGPLNNIMYMYFLFLMIF